MTTEAKRAVATILATITPDDEKVFQEVIEALGWGIATLSAMPGEREVQAEFLSQTFKAILWDAHQAMTGFEQFRAKTGH
jgi:hypothetical protein